MKIKKFLIENKHANSFIKYVTFLLKWLALIRKFVVYGTGPFYLELLFNKIINIDINYTININMLPFDLPYPLKLVFLMGLFVLSLLNELDSSEIHPLISPVLSVFSTITAYSLIRYLLVSDFIITQNIFLSITKYSI